MVYPKMESFVMEVKETWLESDVFKSSEIEIYTAVDELGEYLPKYPKYRRNTAERRIGSIDLTGILNGCYHSGKPEKRKSSAYEASIGDDETATIHVVCRIKYISENSIDQKSDTTK